MLKNYLKIAFRQLRKQKMYALIKTGGFAFSIAACLLIGLYISQEVSHDKSYPYADRIYRIILGYHNDDSFKQYTGQAAPTASTLKASFPEVETTGRILPKSPFLGTGSVDIKCADAFNNTHEDGVVLADQSLFDMLQLPMIYGNRETALSEPLTMVISKSMADKYYPNQDPVGKVMLINNDKTKPYRIGAVMQDLPATSHLKYNFLLTLTGYAPEEQSQWRSYSYVTYLKLKQGTDVAAFEKKMRRNIVLEHIVPVYEAAGNKMADEAKKRLFLTLQNVADIHLRSNGIEDGLPHGDIRFVWLFGAIALFILVIACINFVNLSTARSANRAKEVGLRKVVGSLREGLIAQFLTESMLYSFLSFIAGLVVAVLLLPYFNQLAGRSLTMPWQNWRLYPGIIAAAVIVGTVAGLYPAFYLSAFKPVDVLKGKLSSGANNSILRNGLVVFQFTASIILIVGTIVIYSQMQYILNKEVGFDKEQVLMIQGANSLDNKLPDFKTELEGLSAISSVSISDYLPVEGTKRSGAWFYNEGRTNQDVGAGAQMWQVDKNYIKTLGMQLVAGRDFNPQTNADSLSVVINQALANQLELKDPVGKRITTTDADKLYTVIGVVKDFNYESLKQEVGGVLMHLGQKPSSMVAIKIKGRDVKHTVAEVSTIWKRFAPGQPIRYTFLDDTFAKMYADVERMGQIFTSFAVLAVLIACLGLFGLAAFMAEQRSKEIGIRKVLGASVSNITRQLSFDFVKLVLIAIVIASPIAWWGMTKWLQDFTYRISVTWWMVLMAAVVSILIALSTVGYQCVKAALLNPAKSLKAE